MTRGSDRKVLRQVGERATRPQQQLVDAQLGVRVLAALHVGSGEVEQEVALEVVGERGALAEARGVEVGGELAPAPVGGPQRAREQTERPAAVSFSASPRRIASVRRRGMSRKRPSASAIWSRPWPPRRSPSPDLARSSSDRVSRPNPLAAPAAQARRHAQARLPRQPRFRPPPSLQAPPPGSPGSRSPRPLDPRPPSSFLFSPCPHPFPLPLPVPSIHPFVPSAPPPPSLHPPLRPLGT